MIFDYVLQMKLDPQLAAWAKHFGTKPDFDWRGPIEVVRRRFWRFAHDLETDAPALNDIRDLEIGGAEGALPARLYTPIGAGVEGPGVVYFHGGAFVLGDLESHELLCRRLADAAHMRVLSVAYRLAPEHRFPAAAEDAIAATRWTAAHGGELGMDGRLAVAGDSAGGNLAAVVSQQTRKDGLGLKAQLLIYPSVQWVEMTPSQLRLREGHLLTQAVQDFFKDKYLRSREDGYDVRASPLLENDLAGLPPAYVVTGNLDPLRDEGKAYADKMAASGVAVTYREYNQPHGFFSMTGISSVAKEAIAEAGAWLAARMG